MNDLVFDRPDLTPPLAKGGRWKLVHDWTVVFHGEYYHIPAGFETDGASIPRPLWWICGTPLEVPRLYAAIIHDFIYGGGDPDATRADADDLFRDVQIDLGVSRLKAYVEWAALRLFGRTHWTKQPTKGTHMKKLITVASIALTSALLGCKSDRTKDVELEGMFTQAESGTLAIGSIEFQAAPKDAESAALKMWWDSPLLAPSAVRPCAKLMLSGTNTCSQASKIVASLTKAIGVNFRPATNAAPSAASAPVNKENTGTSGASGGAMEHVVGAAADRAADKIRGTDEK